MDQASLYATEARCTQEHAPQCQDHCPLQMDVRTFMAYMADGNLNNARKVIDKHLPLPNIFAHICDHPCQNNCLRYDLGGSLAIQSLESFCLAHTEKQSKGFVRPPKTKKIAILGNGLAGLVASYELAKKSFPITIYYEAEEYGQDTNIKSFIQNKFPSLTPQNIEIELSQLEKQYVSFVKTTLTPEFFESIQQDFAGFFIDIHAAPSIFKSLGKTPDIQTGHLCDNICAAGMLKQSPTGNLYASSSLQAGQGREAALSLERIIGGVAPSAGREYLNTGSKLHTPLKGLEILNAITPASGCFSLEEAQLEAKRCIQCQCMQCVTHCVYLQKYGSFPRNYTRQIYNNAAIVQGEHRANALINGCMLCGQCTEICPERFSMAEVCLQARSDMVQRNYMPPSAHAFALEDMQAATQNNASLFMSSSQQTEKNNTAFAFFPGCQLSAARGNQVLKVYEFLCSHLTDGVGLMLSCCGIPAQWAGHNFLAHENAQNITNQWEKLGKPTVILACASCKKFFEEQLKQIPCTSLWEILYAKREHIPALPTNLPYTIHDPCAARNDKDWQNATRLLAKHCGIECTEAVNNKEITPCCGYGGLVWCAQPQLAEQATAQLAQNLGKNTALASCIMCRDRLVLSKKACLHFFDILPFLSNTTKQQDLNSNFETASMQAPPSLSARRANRVKLVQDVIKQYGTDNILVQDSIDQQFVHSLDNYCFLHINPELLAELEAKHILHQDAAAAVLSVEKHKTRFLEQESGHYIGAWQSGQVTFWVRYSYDSSDTEQKKFFLHDAWCHRMLVPNTTKNT